MVKNNMKKRGLSPLIATVLLVAIAVIALGLIFVWFNTIKTEQIQKFGIPIGEQCNKLDFKIELSSNKITIENNGEISIYGINLEINKDGDIITRFLRPQDGFIGSKESDFVTATTADLSGKIESIVAVPVILGETSSGEGKLNPCLDRAEILL